MDSYIFIYLHRCFPEYLENNQLEGNLAYCVCLSYTFYKQCKRLTKQLLHQQQPLLLLPNTETVYACGGCRQAGEMPKTVLSLMKYTSPLLVWHKKLAKGTKVIGHAQQTQSKMAMLYMGLLDT